MKKKLILMITLSLCGAALFGQQKKLVVTPFENRGTKLNAAELSNLQDYLINAFMNTGRYEVPDRNALKLLAEEQKFQLDDWSDDKKSAAMGKVLNADYIVRVIVMHDGEGNVLSARILDVNTANGLAAGSMEFTTQRDARGKMEGLVSKIVQRNDANARPANTAQGANKQKKLVVTPFENRGAKLDAAALNNLQDNLIDAFINTGRFQVPDRNALALLADENKFQLSDWADERKSAAMGKVLNADYIVRVIMMHDGEGNVLSARILDVNTANGLGAGEIEFTAQRDARGKMEQLVGKILQRIGGIAGAGPASPVRPPSNTVRPASTPARPAVRPSSFLPHFIGAGSTFSTPLLTLSVYNHKTIIYRKYSRIGGFIDYGCDLGLFHAMSGAANVNYYSFYPNAHLNVKAGLRGNDRESTESYYFHFGLGAGYMLAAYEFPSSTVRINTLALDAATGLRIGDIHLLYNARIAYPMANHKLTIGFYIPY